MTFILALAAVSRSLKVNDGLSKVSVTTCLASKLANASVSLKSSSTACLGNKSKASSVGANMVKGPVKVIACQFKGTL